ncbi:hypothetical protein Tco_0452193 [Tanacetum coccineum]
MMLHVMPLSPTEAGYMTLTKAAKEAIGLKGLAIESGFELKIVAGIATGSLSKAIPGPRILQQVVSRALVRKSGSEVDLVKGFLLVGRLATRVFQGIEVWLRFREAASSDEKKNKKSQSVTFGFEVGFGSVRSCLKAKAVSSEGVVLNTMLRMP